MKHSASGATLPLMRRIVPSLASWDSDLGALGNLLLFGLAALGAEWLVHQLEYQIEYGRQFAAVMDRSPHHIYTAPEGVVLAVLMTLAVAGALLMLCLNLARRRALLSVLPARWRETASSPRFHVPLSSVARTAGILAIYQTGLYILQENAEWQVMGLHLPGLMVVFAPQHLTVLPLHALFALCTSLLLWTVSTIVQTSRRAVERVAALLLHLQRLDVPGRRVPATLYIPTRRRSAGKIGLRSPPLTAAL